MGGRMKDGRGLEMVRKPISKKVRFEVFKRDKFICQYCGEKAPDVILHVDHIQPLASGGDSDITNLVTACAQCNLGKGARRLDDAAVLEKQRQELEAIEERRQQLEMLLEWRQELESFDDYRSNVIVSEIEGRLDLELTDAGIIKARKWLKKYSDEEVLSALSTSAEQYLDGGLDGEITFDSKYKAFQYIPRIINVQRRSDKKPYLPRLYYIRGILRNRLNHVNEWQCLGIMESAVNSGMPIEALELIAKSATSWTNFADIIDEYLDDIGGGDDAED